MNFIDEYTKLDAERDTGDGIWRLCEMSAQVISPRGEHESLDEWRQRNGTAVELAVACRKSSVDFIERRAFAWREWERFRTGADVSDEDWDSRQFRDRLSYSHFCALGRRVERGKLDDDVGYFLLMEAAKNGQSVAQMAVEGDKMTKEFYCDIWPAVRKRIKRVAYGYPEVHGRLKRLLVELVATDWEAKYKDNV